MAQLFNASDFVFNLRVQLGDLALRVAHQLLLLFDFRQSLLLRQYVGLFLLPCAIVCGFKLGLQAINLRVKAFVVVAHDVDGFLQVRNLQCLSLQLIPGEHLPEKTRLLLLDVLDLPQLLF